MRYRGLRVLMLALACLVLVVDAVAVVAQPPPPPTATPDFATRNEGAFVEGVVDFVVEVGKYVVTGLIMVVAYALGKPRYDHWLERRRRRLEQKAEARDKQAQDVSRRHVEDERLQAYLDQVAQEHNHIRVLGQMGSIPLSDIFTEVYVLNRPEAERRFDVQRMLADTEHRRDPRVLFERLRGRNERKAGRDFLADPKARRLFILGQPGAGKTTFLRYLACQAATGTLKKVPVFVTLREWAESEQRGNLFDYIVRQFALFNFPDAQAYVERLLEARDDALVLFDGLDEVPQTAGARSRVLTALKAFAQRYERAQVLVTCRVAATDYAFEGFTYIEVADFTDEQIRTYARKWFRHDASKKDLFLKDLEKPEHQNLRELARAPLLLGLLCLNFDETMRFPTRRVSLYTEALDALLKKWDSLRGIQRDYQVLDVARKHQLFTQLAYPAFVRGEYLFSQKHLAQAIGDYMRLLPQADHAAEDSAPDGGTVLRAIEAQHGILVERAYEIHAFAHLTFQEYYTARYIAESTAPDTWPEILAHAAEDRWREVLLLTASLLRHADGFFVHFLDVLDHIAREGALGAFLGWARRKAGTVDVPYKPAATRAYYAWLARDLTRARDRARDLARARALVRDRDLARARALNLDLDLALDFARDLDRALALDLDRARALAQDSGASALYAALEGLIIPDAEAPAEAWDTFAKQFQEIMIEHRDIGHDWNFSDEQVTALERYFTVATLLVECLDMARVSDRAAIEARLVMPPAN